jgi:glutathione S-transferase
MRALSKEIIAAIKCGCISQLLCQDMHQNSCPPFLHRRIFEMKLYGSPVSPFVRKVLVYADVKGIALELVPVGLADPNPEFAQTSPFRKIPGFSDGDFKISDSTAIVTYLEAKHPSPPMLGDTPEERARIMWYDEFADTIFTPATGPAFFHRIVAPKFLGQEPDHAAADKAEHESTPPMLDYLESVIPASGYLVGDRLTLADISVACPFVNADHAGIKIDAGKYPKITKWLAGILALNGFATWVAREKKMLGRN